MAWYILTIIHSVPSAFVLVVFLPFVYHTLDTIIIASNEVFRHIVKFSLYCLIFLVIVAFKEACRIVVRLSHI